MIKNGYTRSDGRKVRPLKWLGYGDWTCTVPVLNHFISSNTFKPACLAHDVAYASLQKFVGTTSNKEIDTTWNVRNKYLADSKLYDDLLEDAKSLNLVDYTTCISVLYSSKFLGESFCYMIKSEAGSTMRAHVMHWAVVHGNSLGKITENVVRHVADNPKFVEYTTQ